MNCKQGDLAIIVRSCCGNEGKIVRCLNLSHNIAAHMPDGTLMRGSFWITDPPIRSWLGDIASVRDANLRPLRPDDGEDEALRIVKQKVAA